MKFIISCATFTRLANVAKFTEPTINEETKQNISCVRIEYKNGKIYAIATNQKIAVVEYLGKTDQPDGVAHVVIDPKLVTICASETPFDSFLEIITVPEIAVASAKTMLGYAHQGNACIFPEQTVMNNWYGWVSPQILKKSKGAMWWCVDHVFVLIESSPSGRVVFPEFIDVNFPVVLRDPKNPNWVGLFLPQPLAIDAPAIPATLPDWWS